MIYIVLNLIPISAATFAALIIGLAYRKASTPQQQPVLNIPFG